MENAESSMTVSVREKTAANDLYWDLLKARAQKAFGYCMHAPFSSWLIATIKWWFSFDYGDDLKKHRKLFKELIADKRPLLICPNHLSYIDSVTMIYIFANHWWYLLNYRCLSWNLPALEYKNTFFFRLVGLANKCIFINRSGSRRHHERILNLSRALLERSEVFTIFPEGRRSKTGTFDDRKLAYGIGKIISGMEECRVLCAYWRPMAMASGGKWPPRKSRLRFETKLITIRPTGEPDEVRKIVRRIADEIMALEKQVLSTAETKA